MKQFFIFLGFLLTAQISLAQTFFEYDQAGNRVKRTFTPVPNLSPSLLVYPGTIYGSSQISAQLRVGEINEAIATSGLITVRLAKQSGVSFNFNPSMTTIGATSVQNANWSFDNSNSYYYTFTSTTPINPGDQSVIGLTGMVEFRSVAGTIPFSMTILGGSGGETKVNDNVTSTKIYYFTN